MPFTRLAFRCMIFPYPDYVVAQAVRLPHPHLSAATLGRDRIPVQYLLDLAYLFQCETDDLIGWCDDGIESSNLSAELPCIESGIDTDIPRLPYYLQKKVRVRPQPYANGA
jgi:hypothetical protein